ncbi:hypothetical protein PILCRDRAFT_15618 [Piloderma croceum F 1598]|uniref:DUF3295 domain-containing protein n=1 Tax=Piloderma croceum (strain F 1598) TaxID=765440 RepID=A0A0C3EYG9_PILCF|nr:hypothetical protein PILCRDRAFT_15618 [Piloderma croceum F 1598]
MGRKEITPPGAHLIIPEAPRGSKPISNADETLKAPDRRFFLQQSPEGELPERGGLADGRIPTASDVVEASSGGSSQLQGKGSAESDRPTMAKTMRKGKEVMRHRGMVRLNGWRAQITRPSVKQQLSGDSKPRPTFNIGSSSSNESKDASNGNGSSLSKVTFPPPVPAPLKETAPKRAQSPIKTAHTQGRRIVIASSASSEYETDNDDDSWCSEDMSAEDNKRTKEDTRLREAALEAQRQWDMFAKVPKRSPDPTIFYSIESAQAPSTSGTNHQHKVKVDGSYKPKGRPQGQEMDDSDSEGDNSDDKIQLVRGVAQERLAALASRRGIERSQSSRPPQPEPAHPVLPTVTSAPIPLGRPYNLPAPAPSSPPSTARTTRRQMLSTELSESLRWNLLWERQVGKNVMVEPKKPNTVLGGALRPLTSMTAGEPSKPSGATLKPSTSHKNREEKAEKDPRKRRAMAQNRSWADNYHYAGW